MDLSLALQFIKPELLIVVVACYVLGLFLKASVVKDWLIPYILLAFAIVLMITYMAIVLGGGFTGKVIVVGFIQGLFAAALSVYGNQLIKQAVGKSQ
jgi:hypothetical protein